MDQAVQDAKNMVDDSQILDTLAADSISAADASQGVHNVIQSHNIRVQNFASVRRAVSEEIANRR